MKSVKDVPSSAGFQRPVTLVSYIISLLGRFSVTCLAIFDSVYFSRCRPACPVTYGSYPSSLCWPYLSPAPSGRLTASRSARTTCRYISTAPPQLSAHLSRASTGRAGFQPPTGDLARPYLIIIASGFHWLVAVAHRLGLGLDQAFKLVMTAALALSGFGVFAWLRYAFGRAACLTATAPLSPASRTLDKDCVFRRRLSPDAGTAPFAGLSVGLHCPTHT